MILLVGILNNTKQQRNLFLKTFPAFCRKWASATELNEIVTIKKKKKKIYLANFLTRITCIGALRIFSTVPNLTFPGQACTFYAPKLAPASFVLNGRVTRFVGY